MRQHCFYCGVDIGPRDRFSDALDTCGDNECQREARYAAEAERADAHEQLDRDMGYGQW